MKLWVGVPASVNTMPRLSVSVENAGWSEASVVKPSSIHEVVAKANRAMRGRRICRGRCFVAM